MTGRDESIDPDAPVVSPVGDRQWDVLVTVAVGGVIGAEARLGVGDAITHRADAFPWSTVLINVSGCLLIGALMAGLALLAAPPRLVRPLLGIGVLGGYTTFSTFSVDADRLIDAHRPGIAVLYVVVTLIGGALATAAGTGVVRTASRRLGLIDRRRREPGTP